MKLLFSLLLFTIITGVVGATKSAKSKARPVNHRVQVEVIVLRDDNGKNPAPVRIEPKLINGLYAAAGVRFEFSKAKFWNNSAALEGKKNLDELTKLAEKSGFYHPKKNIIYMFFVNAVDGNRGPLGRGMLNGNILYNCQGPKADRFRDAFVIAHEAGHNLNLIHTVDDPKVPNELVNVMGDGPYKERLALSGLHPTQIKTILKSRLTVPILKK